MSGFSKDPVKASPLRFGFNDSIRKPFTGSEVERFLDAFIPPRPARGRKGRLDADGRIGGECALIAAFPGSGRRPYSRR
jgi:hypothetical protein